MAKTDFSTETSNLRTESTDIISFSKLLSLVKDVDQTTFLASRFNPEGEEFNIEIKKVDIAYKYVKKWTTKFKYHNLELSGNEIKNYFLISEDENLDAGLKDMIFVIPEIKIDSSNAFENVKCRAVYSSKDQFYDEIKLCTHINFLKNNGYNDELKKINDIWSGHKEYEKKKKYKFLKLPNNQWFLRSINSTGFQEYGTAFTFAFTILLMDEIRKNNDKSNFSIELLTLNESKISMTISQGTEKELEGLGYVKSSIVLSNNDLGKGSFKLTKNITLIPKVDDAHSLSIAMPKKSNVNEVSIGVDHSTLLLTLNDKFSGMHEDFWSIDEFVKDYNTILKLKNPEGVRSAIEQKIEASTILQKCNELKNLFRPSQSGVIDNLAKLINLCGKADNLNIDYDLKSKLRQIISEVLFTKKNY